MPSDTLSGMVWFPEEREVEERILALRVVVGSPRWALAYPVSPTVAENEAVHNLHGKPGGCDTGAL